VSLRELRHYRLRLLWLGGLAATLFLIFLATAGSTYALRGGRDELVMVQQAREWQSLVAQLVQGANRYVETAPRSYEDYHRDTATYWRQLRSDLELIEQRLDALRASYEGGRAQGSTLLVPAARGALGEALSDMQTRWSAFRTHLDERLGDQEQPRLEWGAQAIIRWQADLQGGASVLSESAGLLLNAHLDRAESIGRTGSLGALVLAGLLGLTIGRTVQRRVSDTLQGCREIAAGRFGHQIPERSVDEFTDLNAAVNQISARIAMVLDMLDGLQRSRDRLSTLSALHEALRPVCELSGLRLYEGESGDTELLASESEGDVETLPTRIDRLSVDAPVRVLSAADSSTQRLLLRLPDLGTRRQILGLASTSHSFAADLRALLGNLAPILGTALQKSVLTEQLLLAAISGLSNLAESRDPETGDHLLRMAMYSRLIASELERRGYPQVDAAFVRDVHRFAPMHDIGKVGVPDSILLKPGPLTAEERAEMNLHPLIGARVLRACAAQLPQAERAMFEIAAQIADGHHERYDGNGYPRGLAGQDIPLAARIVAIADVFDALTSKRPYKQAWSFEDGLAALRKDAGAHFDPELVDAAFAVQDAMRAVYDEHKHV
jgi:HD-GYP domain-containing protein (c-di-GMP phosphodiesterase class II)